MTTQIFRIITGFAKRLLNRKPNQIWVEIRTDSPTCIYYFGPFDNWTEAEESRSGYLQDLHIEGAQGIHAEIKYCNPSALTICQDLDEA